MSKNLLPCILVFIILVNVSCKKDETKTPDVSAIKRSWVTGTWKQKDLVLAYPIPFGGQDLPIGFSVYNLTGYLPVSGPMIECSKDNTYTFNADSTFAISGCTELMLPDIGAAGKWRLEIYDAVLRLTSANSKSAPYWTNSITEKEWSIGMSIYLAEADASIPVNLLLEKN